MTLQLIEKPVDKGDFVMPAESILRRWVGETPSVSEGYEVFTVVFWFAGVFVFLAYTWLVFQGGFAFGQSEAFRTCSEWRIRK